MGGKSSDKSSRKMMEMQEKEAAEARAKEVARKGRIDQGLASIKAAFHGAPVMGTRQVNRAATSTPGEWTTQRVWVPNDSGQQIGGGGSGLGGGGGGGRGIGTDKGGKWVNKRVRGPGTSTPGGVVSESYDTGQTSGGFDQAFYDKYAKNISDYYGQDVANQYADAKDELTYRLARAGQLRSDVAGSETADLAGQNTKNVAKVFSDADKAAAELKNRVAQEEQNAIAQLYATENPEVAASNVLHTAQNLSAEKADLSPLADIFKIAAIGGANFAKGAQNAQGVAGARSVFPSRSRWGATNVTG